MKAKTLPYSNGLGACQDWPLFLSGKRTSQWQVHFTADLPKNSNISSEFFIKPVQRWYFLYVGLLFFLCTLSQFEAFTLRHVVKSSTSKIQQDSLPMVRGGKTQGCLHKTSAFFVFSLTQFILTAQVGHKSSARQREDYCIPSVLPLKENRPNNDKLIHFDDTSPPTFLGCIPHASMEKLTS